jgi:hypothetical protein
MTKRRQERSKNKSKYVIAFFQMMYDRIPPKVTRRVGNWCEESVLRQEKLKAFMTKIETGEMAFKRRETRIKLVNEPRTLGKSMEFQKNVMIKVNFHNAELGYKWVFDRKCSRKLSQHCQK